MNRQLQDALAEKLTRQRAVLFGEMADMETGLRFIEEDRESELEERAQEEREAALLARLDDQGRRALTEIDAALRRLADGTYGACEVCGELIADRRLQALPATRFCIDCARAHEHAPPPAAEELVHHPGAVPPDFSLLSDPEIAAMIREEIRRDGRVDMEELRILCRHGVVRLDGALPSESERSILRQIITDTLGLEEIIDHVQIKELLWEREERTKTAPPGEAQPWEEAHETEDIVESHEEGVEYAPPISPSPEEE